jgi:dipeptidyl aminopeptidase/acylaminoacyl peptidase
VISAGFSPDGRFLATGANRGGIVVLDLAKNDVAVEIPAHTLAVRTVAFSPDGKTLASCGEDRKIRRWDVADWRELQAPPEQAKAVKWLAFAPDGKTFATVTLDNAPGEITAWDAGNGEPRWVIRPRAGFWMIAFSPDGKTLAAPAIGPRGLFLYDAATGREQPRLPLEASARPIAFSRDGRLMAVGLYKAGVVVWDVAKNQRKWTLPDPKENLFRLDFSPDGKALAIADEGGSFTLQDLSRTPEDPPGKP